MPYHEGIIFKLNEILNGAYTMDKSNMTYLFEQPRSKHHNSESFWTSLFALHILSLSQSQQDKYIPTYRFQVEGKEWKFTQHETSFCVPPSLLFTDVVVEGGINETTFKGVSIDNELYAIKPDIIVQKDKKISIIEVKTTGRHCIGAHQKSLYDKLIVLLGKNGYKADLFFLMSVGHEKNSDWELLQKNPAAKILLWEKVLEEICNSKNTLGQCLGDQSQYYKSVELEGRY